MCNPILGSRSTVVYVSSGALCYDTVQCDSAIRNPRRLYLTLSLQALLSA